VLDGERQLLEVASDPLVHRLQAMAKSVHRDIHKMHAFLRFREVGDPDGRPRYVAWFEPQHHIVEAAAGFFVERFRSMAWSILTPQGSLHWDRAVLRIGPPARRDDALREQGDGDRFEAAWRCYYESVFNPARTNPRAMRQHMPAKYWRNLPEAAAIDGLLRGAPRRVHEMLEREAAAQLRRDPVKAVAAMSDLIANGGPRSLEELNRTIAASPPLTPGADRAVLGEGPVGAAIAFVGEQPGDQEEREGRPFVGPAGQLLDRALAEAGIDRATAYLTNAVKHFKYEPRGKKRLHKRPNPGEVKRYRWWLQKELAFVRPHLVVALGNTALLGLTGEPLSVMKVRGPLALLGYPGYATVHPSYLLRLPDEAARQAAYGQFRDDLARAARLATRRAA
jgi:DNA polymerase